MSSICGGVISESQNKKDMEEFGVWANAMAYVMPDEHYKKYIEYKENGQDKEARRLFEKYARSQI